MSVLVVHDWKFDKVADAPAGMEAAEKFVGTLCQPDRGVEASIWTRDWQDAHRHLHIPIYRDMTSLEAVFAAPDTQEFAGALYPLVSDQGATNPVCEVVMSSGGRLPALAWGGVGGGCVVNDFAFADASGVAKGMEAAAEYLEVFARRDELVLSIWARAIEEPLRFFHIVLFVDQGAPGAGRRWPETVEFAERLFPHLDADSVEQVFTEVVLSSGGELPRIDLRL